MLDIKWIRDNADDFDAALARRGKEPHAAAILALDTEKRRLLTEIQEMQSSRNEESKKIGMLKKAGEDAEPAIKAVAEIKKKIAANEEALSETDVKLNDFLTGLPNIPAADVPDGETEDDNVEVALVGKKPDFDFDPKEHDVLGTELGLLDFEAAARLSGARFVVVKGALARLERAIAQYMLDTHTQKNGYTEVNPPVLVKDDAMYGTGQLPKFAEDSFQTKQGHWLIPTAEVSLTNMVSDQILNDTDLPLRFVAFTPCFRSEAGAAGKDTRGMIRQHQFGKVEMVSITHPEQSMEELARETSCAEAILTGLGLAYRKIVLCTGDMGFGSVKTYDLEVWVPGQHKYREISSCSNCGDFQARRMNARFKKEGEKGTRFVHTLNGSGLAVGRTLVAVMENYQQADGSIRVPDALKPYMGGIEVITKE